MLRSLVNFFTEYEKNQLNSEDQVHLDELTTKEQIEDDVDDKNTLEYINSITNPIEKAKALKNAIEFAK